jgi:hypothetical protein
MDHDGNNARANDLTMGLRLYNWQMLINLIFNLKYKQSESNLIIHCFLPKRFAEITPKESHSAQCSTTT